MDAEELRWRTKKFALRIIEFVETLPRLRSVLVLGNQLVRSATSVGANYRSACRARSKSDFISKISIVEEEADETAYWLELISGLNLVKSNNLDSLLKEAKELTAIFTASRRTAKFK
jgi:four helix bundle protein